MIRYPTLLLLTLSLACCEQSAPQQAQQDPVAEEFAVSAVVQEPVLEIAGEVKYAQNKLVKLVAKNANPNGSLRWRVTPGADVQRATSPGRKHDGTKQGAPWLHLEFVAPPGVYEVELEVITVGPDMALQFDVAYAKVTIEGNAPGPKPPEPPTPPGPLDPFAAELRALYLADASATRQADLMLLVELYRQASDLAKSPDVTTLSALAQRVAGAGASLLPRERLTAMRRRIAEYVAREFGDVDAPLTPELRTKTSAAYAKVHAALKQIGG